MKIHTCVYDNQLGMGNPEHESKRQFDVDFGAMTAFAHFSSKMLLDTPFLSMFFCIRKLNTRIWMIFGFSTIVRHATIDPLSIGIGDVNLPLRSYDFTSLDFFVVWPE